MAAARINRPADRVGWKQVLAQAGLEQGRLAAAVLGETAAVEEPTEPKEPKEATLSVAEQENAEWVSELKQSVIVGDFAHAVEVCFKYGRFADALVLSAWGGSELVQQTTVVLRRLSERRTATCASKRRRRSSRWRRSCLAI